MSVSDTSDTSDSPLSVSDTSDSSDSVERCTFTERAKAIIDWRPNAQSQQHMDLADSSTSQFQKRGAATEHAKRRRVVRPTSKPGLGRSQRNRNLSPDSADSSRSQPQQRGAATEHAKRSRVVRPTSKPGLRRSQRNHNLSLDLADSSRSQLQKRGAAAEHAKQSRGAEPNVQTQQRSGSATERTQQQVVLQPNAAILRQMESAQAERADNRKENLLKNIADFLATVLREICCSGRA